MRQTTTEDQVPEARGVAPWLASLMLKRGGGFLPRFAYYYRQLARRPRHWRRQLRRQLAVTVTGAALLLAIGGVQAQVEPVAPENVITVVNGEVALAANGRCSLMEAIINARATRSGQLQADCAAGNLSAPDTVQLPANGLFTLTAAHNAQFGPTGLPVITTSMTIEGNGATIRRSTTSGTPDFRHLVVDPGVSLTLKNLTLTNGYSYSYHGGAILNKGQLQITGSTFSGNTVVDENVAYGGAIFNEGTLNVGSSLFQNNRAFSNYYSYGGAITGRGPITISGSAFENNNVGADTALGGAVAAVDATISGSRFAGNSAGDGGAVIIFGDALISGSTFTGNSVRYGANSYGLGGAILNDGALVVVNSTFSGNQADAGGGIANSEQLTLVNSTLSGNTAYRGGGVAGVNWSLPYGYQSYDCSQTILRRSILSGNTAPTGREAVLDAPGPTCASTMTANSQNVFGRAGSSGLGGFSPGATDIVPSVGLSAILSPLANNGGPTLTHALPAGSPAIDRAPSSACAAAPVNSVDQRGQPRNQNGAGGTSSNECDIGAFELGGGAPPAAVRFFVSPLTSGTVGGVAFAPADILKYDPSAGWSMHFDASDVGITKNVVAFEILGDNSILLSLAASQAVSGVGTVAAHDVIRFVPTATGVNTGGSFQPYVDGSNVGLTTTAEKVDALGLLADGRIAVSTVGAVAVAGPGGTTLKGQDEDALAFNRTNATWAAYFDGTPLAGMAVEDLNALWVNPTTGELYISIVGAFNLGGVAGDGKDIVKLTPNGAGGYTPSLVWDGSAAGFPSTIDGLEMMP